ncbi:methyltransferase domain-containing protein [Luteimonas sp. SJ-92]|uniref:Methyltransferase domain-containing protein n=1 Tax=Luteimonas salinisoli TaxID=2752307 RepID=A0A853JAI1_9GAMM|nr:methyltransferase domain-containing protein [Luteimonas salinisoli]NZA25668.1 methyltransferase domain-containing protein [Luteimonas salinisoli]
MSGAAPVYVHGYDASEHQRLHDQAGALEALLHAGTAYPPGSAVLEAGCGVGAQTVVLARNSPQARIVAVDVSPASIAEARRRVEAAGCDNVRVLQADILDLPLAEASFDHVFVCFVLEHLSDPLCALGALRRLLRPGGTITVIEGDHGSAFFHPDHADARAAIACLVELQRRAGGDALIGRRLTRLLQQAGFAGARTAPRTVHADGGCPELAEAFTRRTFAAMVAATRDAALRAGLIAPARFDAGVAALHRTAAADGALCYTFFKTVAVR